MKKVILNLGTGTLEKGCDAIIGEILSGGEQYPVRFGGELPAAPELAELQRQWQQLYHQRNQDQALRIRLLDVEGFRYSAADFEQVCHQLARQLNTWLKTDEFRSVDQMLRTELERTDDVQLILETPDPQLQRLPWHLWQLCEDYPNIELTFASSTWRPLSSLPSPTKDLRVLATFGNGNGLDLTADLAAWNNLPDTQLKVLDSPGVNQLHEALWQPEGWDMFFFAGHSQTQDDTGIIDLNETDRLTVAQIKHALGKAIANGLKIAIFNSCDGLGLAQQLSALQIPYVVIMREPVPDHIAQQFLHYLLMAFSGGLPFHLAVKEARRRLTGLDHEIPCASWLPIIWQNPTAPAINWQDFHQDLLTAGPAAGPAAKSMVTSGKRPWLAPILKGVLATGAVMGLRLLGGLEPFELVVYDHLMRQRPAESVDPRIVVVEISQEATSEYGYPLPDETLTRLIDQVTQANPMAIGLDIHRPRALNGSGVLDSGEVPTEAQPSANPLPGAQATGYERFLQQVEENPALFLVCAYSSTDENYRAPLQLSDDLRLHQVGFSDMPTDVFSLRSQGSRSDVTPQGSFGVTGNRVRRQLLSYDPDLFPAPSSCITPYSFSFQLAFQYLATTGVSPMALTADEHWQFGSVVMQPMPQRFGGYQSLPGTSDQLMLNYRANQPAQKITLEQILTNNFDPALLRDRVVIIGYTAPVSKDYFETPYGPMAGLWVHTHMVSQLMSAVLDGRPLLRVLPQWRSWQWGDWLWVLSWSGVAAYASWQVQRRSHWLATMAVGGVTLYGVCWVAMISGLWLPLVPTAFATLTAASWVRLSRSATPGLPSAASGSQSVLHKGLLLKK